MLNTSAGVVLKTLTVVLTMKTYPLSTAKLAQTLRILRSWKRWLPPLKWNTTPELRYQNLHCKFSVHLPNVDFPTSGRRFDEFETLTMLNLFDYFHRIINVKIHLHHSHVPGKIHGYVHNFCNMQVRENSQMQFSCIAHNVFGFDMFLLLKRIGLSV